MFFLWSRKKITVYQELTVVSIAAPGSFSELETLLHGHSSDEQTVIISRLRKCHHPSLAEGNKEKLEVWQLLIDKTC